MTDLPGPVLAHLTGAAIRSRSPAFLQAGRDGKLKFWGGPLSAYGLPELEVGLAVAEDVPLLAGLLPAEKDAFVAPCVSSGTGWPADVHVFRDGDDDWIVFVDAREEQEKQRLLQQKANELALTHEREARLIEELDAFAHTVAHDLRSPLTGIIGFSDLLRSSGADLNDDKRRLFLDSIVKSGQRMSRIIDELLLLSSVRKQAVAFTELDMAEIVAGAIDRFSFLVRDTAAEITLPDSWPPSIGHAGWVEEVWANYLSNAVKYGGQPPKLEVGAIRQDDGMVRFWVTDNGPGISADDQSRLFTPHTRLDRSRATGHGLGLSIVQRIVHKLGGEVSVESMLGEGSTFSFTLRSADQGAARGQLASRDE